MVRQPLILGISASLRNARFGAGSIQLVRDLRNIETVGGLREYLSQQGAEHLENFRVAGRAERLPFDELYKNLKKQRGTQGLSNSEVALAAALWSACRLGADIEHASLHEYFTEADRGRDFEELYERICAADGVLVSGPVYFGDRGSLAQSLVAELLLRAGQSDGTRHAGKLYGGLAVGAKRNGGQETTLIYQMYDMAQSGFLCVGNDSETTSQYGGTGHAGDVGSMPADEYGLETSMGTGRRIARLANVLALGDELPLQGPLKVSLWILQDKDHIARETAERLAGALVETGHASVSTLDLCKQSIHRCIACDVCPTHIDVDDEYRCIIKSPQDDFDVLHATLLGHDLVIPITYSSRNRSGIVSAYQRFIERTRYLRRGDYALGDLLVFPLSIEEPGASEGFALRAMTSLIRHHTVIHRPATAWRHGGEILNFNQIVRDAYSAVEEARRLASGRIQTMASNVDHLKYNPVGYVLSAMKDAEDERLERRKNMMERRVESAREALGKRTSSTS